jgi:hypothetical protein
MPGHDPYRDWYCRVLPGPESPTGDGMSSVAAQCNVEQNFPKTNKAAGRSHLQDCLIVFQ